MADAALERIVAKIRKLRALAQSTNLNEAAAAAAAAERLLQEHQIAEAEIAAADAAGDVAPVEDASDVATWGKRVPAWQRYLLSGLAETYGCSTVIERWRSRNTARLYGRPADIETVRFQYAFFSVEVVRLCNALGRGRGMSWRSGFCRGACVAIMQAILSERGRAKMHATSAALVVLDERVRAADRLIEEKFGRIRTARRAGPTTSADGLAAGKEAGRGISMRSQISATGERLLGSG